MLFPIYTLKCKNCNYHKQTFNYENAKYHAESHMMEKGHIVEISEE